MKTQTPTAGGGGGCERKHGIFRDANREDIVLTAVQEDREGCHRRTLQVCDPLFVSRRSFVWLSGYVCVQAMQPGFTSILALPRYLGSTLVSQLYQLRQLLRKLVLVLLVRFTVRDTKQHTPHVCSHLAGKFVNLSGEIDTFASG